MRKADRHGLYNPFLFTMIMNPQTLVWVGLAQLYCDLPAHSRCVARGVIFDTNLASRNIDVCRTR